MRINPLYIAKELVKKFSQYDSYPSNSTEENLKMIDYISGICCFHKVFKLNSHIFFIDLLLSSFENQHFELQVESSLILDDSSVENCIFDDDLYVESDDEGAASSEDVSLDDKKAAVSYWKSGKKALYSLLTVQKKFRFITSIRQLYRYEDDIKSRGNRIDKCKEICEFTMLKFNEAREKT